MAIGVILSFNCAETGAAQEQAATRMAARNTLRRAETSIECNPMTVEFLLRTRRWFRQSAVNSRTMTRAQSRVIGGRVVRGLVFSRGGGRGLARLRGRGARGCRRPRRPRRVALTHVAWRASAAMNRPA